MNPEPSFSAILVIFYSYVVFCSFLCFLFHAISLFSYYFWLSLFCSICFTLFLAIVLYLLLRTITSSQKQRFVPPFKRFFWIYSFLMMLIQIRSPAPTFWSWSSVCKPQFWNNSIGEILSMEMTIRSYYSIWFIYKQYLSYLSEWSWSWVEAVNSSLNRLNE